MPTNGTHPHDDNGHGSARGRHPHPGRPGRGGPLETRVLDPRHALAVSGIDPQPTEYVGQRLVVSLLHDHAGIIEKLGTVADDLGWVLDVEAADSDDGTATPAEPKAYCHCDDGPLGLVRVSVRMKDGGVGPAPDGWQLLQHARAKYSPEEITGLGLDHVMRMTPAWKPAGGAWNGSGGAWNGSGGAWNGSPADAGASRAIQSYGVQGFGALQPVAFAGARPHRRTDAEMSGRRPVVAILDTGCGEHPWLDGVVRTDVTLDGSPIGEVLESTDPEHAPDQAGAHDGLLDPMAGHGTFIAGLVHQGCPDADILAWRVMTSSGHILESDWLTAVTQIAELARRHAAGEPGGHPIDVLNLSMGYYHETPDDFITDPTIVKVLDVLGRAGTTVVCSAGNDATTRPFYPAAFGPHDGGSRTDRTSVPIISVGSKNPNGTVAMYSNFGAWVSAYGPGTSVLSTIPHTFQGSAQPGWRLEHGDITFETVDGDDFSSGFAVWSGTSFSAPVIAAKVADNLLGHLPTDGDTQDMAVARAWGAVRAVTGLEP